MRQASMIRRAAWLALASSLVLGAALCAPSAQQHQQQAKASATGEQINRLPSSSTTSTARPAASAQQRSSEAAPLATPAAGPATGPLGDHEPESNLDAKSLFGDDSLWQMPIHLVRDLSELSAREPLANSASTRQAELDASSSPLDQLASEGGHSDEEAELDELSSPQLISASTSSPAASAAPDLKTAAGYNHATPHHYGGGGHHDYHGKYYQYANVPYPYAWEFGYRRGNPYHTIERHEHGKGPHFQTKVKWSDKHGGYGVHVWDYNHDDHHQHHYGGGHHDSYKPSHYEHGHHGHGHGYGHH